jgi:hypothetical protein
MFQGVKGGLDLVELMSVSCLWPMDYHQRLAFTVSTVLAYPLIFMLYVALRYLLQRFILRQTSSQFLEWMFERSYQRSVARTCKFLFTLVSPNIMTASLQHFQCISVYGGNFVRSELEASCDSQEWRAWSFVAAAGICAVALPPLVLSRLLYQGRGSWSQARFDDFLSPWTEHFCARCFWYESFRLERKCAFAIIVTVIKDPESQVFAAMFLLMCSLLTTSLSRPFRFSSIDLIDIGGQFAVALCILVASTYCGPQSDPRNNFTASAIVLSIVGGSVVIALVAAVLLWRKHFNPPAEDDANVLFDANVLSAWPSLAQLETSPRHRHGTELSAVVDDK